MLTLTACGGGNTDKPDDKDDNGKIKVALLIGQEGDMSFSDSAARGVRKAGAELNADVTVIEYGTNPDKFEPTVVDTAEAGYDMIITSSTLTDLFQQYAPEFPDTTFVLFDGQVDYSTGDVDNVYSIVYSANEGSFLGGYVMASLTETGVIGFLGGMEAPIIQDFLLGYVAGAQQANPDIKIAAQYVGAWSDAAKGKEMTLTMHDRDKADYVFNVAGGSGLGAIDAAVERGFYVLGVDSDQHLIFKETGDEAKANVIPTSVLKNVDNSLFRAIDLFIKGELKVGEVEVLGLNEEGVGIADNDYYKEMVSEDIRNAVKELQEKVQKGEIKVDSAYDKTTEEINQVLQSVRP